MSIPSLMPGVHGALDGRRLRAALRVLLDAGQADAAAERILASADPLIALRMLASDLTRQRQFSRFTAWLSRGRRTADSRLQPYLPDDVQPRAMLGLVLQVGLDVDSDRLEDAFGIETQQVGLDLLRARSTFSDRSIAACRDYGWIIGLYRARGLATDDRVRLLSHVKTCDACRDTLEYVQQADAALLAALDRELETLPERSPRPHAGHIRRHQRVVAIAAGSVALLLALAVGIAVISRWISPEDAPVPLFAGDAAEVAPLDGWLLQVSPVGHLEGVNLATGQKRGLDSGDSGGNFSPLYRVSRTHIAAWRPSDGQRDDILTIGPIGEQVDFRLTWNRQFVYWYPSGWLDDDTLLIVKSPEHISGETEVQYLDRLTLESRLVAFDAVTGAENVLMTGNVAAAYPSPDGTMLAILHPIDRRWPGNTLEMRPFDGRSVGEPVIQIEHRIVADGVWLADSSRFVTSVIADESVTSQDAASSDSLAERGVQGVALESIGRAGDRLMLAHVATPETIDPIAAAPVDGSIVYEVRTQREQSRFAGVPEYEWRCYWLSSSGGDPVLLTAGASPERIFQPAWSPDGSTLVLPVARAFPLSTDGSIQQPTNPNATTLLLFDAGWVSGSAPQAIYSSGRDLYGWLQPGALEPRQGMTSGDNRSLAAVELAEQELGELSISAGSVAGSDGAYLIGAERGSRTPLIWNVAGQRQRRLADDTTDLAWFNQGRSTIGVAPDQDGNGASRIVLNAADVSSTAAFLDYHFFDPAGLGNATDRRYALPRVAPSGTTYSFVVDGPAGHVSLWVGDSARPARIVAEWTVPADGIVQPPIVTVWARSDTLLFVQPDDWRDGMPRTAVLSRVVIVPGGEVEVDALVRLDAARGAQGVVLAELALSPDSTQLAYRLRHYESASEDSESNDTLHVAGTDDLGRAIELERGGAGEGIAWTSSGNGLVAGVRGRIALYSPDGRDIEYLSPRDVQSSYPVRIGEQIWFEAVDDRGGSIWQVELD